MISPLFRWPNSLCHYSALAGVIITLLFNALESKRRRKNELEDVSIRRINEFEDAKRIQDSDLCFISTQLIFILEEFAQRCADVAGDQGELENREGEESRYVALYPIPALSFNSIEGNWKSIPPLLMFMTLEIPVILQDARQQITQQTEYIFPEIDDHDYLRIRGSHIAPIGLRAAAIARRLRRKSGFFDSPLSNDHWSAVHVMQRVRKRGLRANGTKTYVKEIIHCLN
ncbi:hypothetical protein SRABI106_00176 [Rahnella aquatilis]|nr:hypothetical protein SRABI106_00176 [Rahnella aquatilis]